MSPPPLSLGRLLELLFRMGMLWLAGAAGGASARSSSESLLLELLSLLEDEELLEFDELSLLIWSMPRASAISSVLEQQEQPLPTSTT